LFTLGGGLIPLLESQLSRPEPELVARCKRLIQALRPRARGAYGSAAAELQVLGPEDQKTMEHLRKLKMDLEFREQSLTGILGYIKEFSGLDVECADGTDSRPLTFQIKGAPLLGALSLLTQSRDLDFRIEGRKIVIDSRDAIEKKIAGKK
jgi:hypothetical protein